MIMGVVYLPRTKEMFYAEKGKGAYLNGKRIHVSNRGFGNAIMCTALPVYHKEYAEICSGIIRETFGKCNDIRRFGACAPELCYLAMGRCELYFEYLLSPWDFAAASLILTEAGGKISGLDGKPLDFVSPCGVIAGNSSENLEELFTIIQKHIG
jgi:myo-inositol-1(or 4)-monophosphatase